MNLSELLSKRLILISGKGGVGKTFVSLLLAQRAAHLKKRTLLVEMNSTDRIAPYFGLEAIGHNETALAPYITGINLNPQDCFEEYVLMRVHFKGIFDAFINNRFVTYFLNAVPGFNELLMIGKIYDLERQTIKKVSRKKQYDLIIVDGPATGHGVSAFEVPQIVHDTVKVGPLQKQSSKILKLLKNPQKTAFSVVTLAEEMPVVEATEMVHMIKQRLGVSLGPLFLNKYHASPFLRKEEEVIKSSLPNPKDPLYPYYAYSHLSVKRAELNEYYEGELRRRNSGVEIFKIQEMDQDGWVKGLGDQ